MGRAVLLALPVFGLTLLIGLMLWPTYPQCHGIERLLALTLQLLAALTLPHLLLDGWVERSAGRADARSRPRSGGG